MALSTGTKIGFGIAGLFVIIGLFTALTLISQYNSGVHLEKRVSAQYQQNQNNLSSYSNKIAEACQVPSMYADDYRSLLKDTVQGTYGKDGAKQAMLWLKERNINYDAGMYQKLQQMIEAGRDKFENEQKKLIDLKRQYETKLDTFPGGVVLRMFGFPKIDLDEIKIITSGYANKAFDTGVEDGLKLR